MQIRVFTKREVPGEPKCQPCRLTKLKLEKLGVPYEELYVDDHRDHLLSLGYSAAPVVEVDLGDGATAHWAGYRPTNIEQLYATLADKLTVPGVVVPESA